MCYTFSLLLFSVASEHPCSAHSRADAHRHNTDVPAGALQLGQDAERAARAGHPQGVPKGDRSSLGVDLLGGELQLFRAVEGLRGERLVELVDVDVVGAQAYLLQHGGDRDRRPDAHDARRHTDDLEPTEHPEDGEAQALRSRTLRQHNSSSPVRRLGRVSGVAEPVGLEGRLQLLQSLQGGRTRALVRRDGDLLLLALLVLHRRRDRHDLLVEETLLLRLEGLLVRAERELVLLLPLDAEVRRHILRGDTHGGEAVTHGLGVGEAVRHFVRDLRRALLGGEAHRLDTGSDSNVDETRLDVRCDLSDGSQPAAALPVDCHNGALLRNASEEGRDTRLQRARSVLAAVADDHVVDHLRLDLRAIDRPLNRGGEHVRARSVLQEPLAGPGHRRACPGQDHDVITAAGEAGHALATHTGHGVGDGPQAVGRHLLWCTENKRTMR
eukprot:Hpha_TRINITY_DN15924_c0_g1::TRINITY_DN15924_c0_g1_i1::g.70742::m.70742